MYNIYNFASDPLYSILVQLLVHQDTAKLEGVYITAEWFLTNLPLTKLKEIIKLQKIYCYSLHKLRLIRWTRTDIRALQYILIAQEITLIVYGQPSTYRRFDSAYRRRLFFSLHHLEHIYEEV